jgi:hypothetical protein
MLNMASDSLTILHEARRSKYPTLAWRPPRCRCGEQQPGRPPRPHPPFNAVGTDMAPSSLPCTRRRLTPRTTPMPRGEGFPCSRAAPMGPPCRAAGHGRARAAPMTCREVLPRSVLFLLSQRGGPRGYGGWVDVWWVRKTLRFFFRFLWSFHLLSSRNLTGGSDVRSKASPSWVRKVFNYFRFL